MQEITITLSSDYILKLLKDDLSIFIEKKDGRIVFGTTPFSIYSSERKKYLLSYDVDEYLDANSDDEVIQDLKDYCRHIKGVQVEII